MSRTEFRMEGFAELERALAEDLPKATARAVLRRTGNNAMRRIEDRERALAPADDGILRESIKTENVKAKFVGRNRRERTKSVEVRTGPSLVSVDRVSETGKVSRRPYAVPGWQEMGTVDTPAQPFIRPAVDAESQNVIDDVRDALAEEIGKAKARIAKRLARKRT